MVPKTPHRRESLCARRPISSQRERSSVIPVRLCQAAFPEIPGQRRRQQCGLRSAEGLEAAPAHRALFSGGSSLPRPAGGVRVEAVPTRATPMAGWIVTCAMRSSIEEPSAAGPPGSGLQRRRSRHCGRPSRTLNGCTDSDSPCVGPAGAYRKRVHPGHAEVVGLGGPSYERRTRRVPPRRSGAHAVCRPSA